VRGSPADTDRADTTDRTTFAIAIPVAAGSRALLRRAIESVRAQTTPHWRLTIVDDTPTSDDARDIANAFGDDRISYVRKGPPHGIAHGWNACFACSDGELLNILHADDELEPDFAAEMLALAQRHPDAALYFAGTSVIDERGAAQFSVRDEFKRLIQPWSAEFRLSGTAAISRLCIGDFINCPTLVYRRSAIGNRRFSEQFRFVLDLDFIMETVLAGGAIVGTSRRLYRYRRHAAQQTAVLSRETLRIDEESAFYRALAVRLRDTPYASSSTFARTMLSTRLGSITNAIADARNGRFVASGAKLKRSLRF
jgi:glycosyltransferase involved in cell wall biosynthesis